MQKKAIVLLFSCLLFHAINAQVTPYTGGEGSGYGTNLSAILSCVMYRGGDNDGAASTQTNLLTCVMYFGGDEDGAAQNSSPLVICPWYFGSEGDGYDGDSAGLCRILLPVRLIIFNGVKEENRNVLFWKTETASPVQYYEVERSGNGVVFHSLGKVFAQPANQFYTFYDNAPLPGIDHYRLQIKERNGEESHSQIVTLKGNAASGIDVHPNPAKDDIWVYYQSPYQGLENLTLTSLNGKQVFSRLIALQRGMNLFNLDVRSLSAGLYVLRIGNTTKPVRVVIAR